MCVCVCVSYGWYQKPGREIEKEKVGVLDFGNAFVDVTQHIIPHISEIYVDLFQYNMASTTPH